MGAAVGNREAGQLMRLTHSAAIARPCRTARGVMMRSQSCCSARVGRCLVFVGGGGECAVDRRADAQVKEHPHDQQCQRCSCGCRCDGPSGQCGEDAGCGRGDDAEDPGDGLAPVTEAMDVAHDRGERGVVDTDEGGSLNERAERVRAVNHPGAQHRDDRGEMGGEVHHAFPAGPAPRGGNAPICWNTSIRFSSSQCSANMPSSARQISMERISTLLPLAGMPMSSPVWVPR
jgi:hypothetical protein